MYYDSHREYEEHMDFVNRCMDLKSVNVFKDLLYGYRLEDFQCVDVLTALVRKECIFSWDTGMGKTLLASAIIKALHNEDPSSKAIFVVKRSQFSQTPKKIEDATGLSVIAISSSEKDIEEKMRSSEFLKKDIVILSAEVLNNVEACLYLHLVREKFKCIVVDELHEFTNFTEADRSLMLQSLLSSFEYKIGLTATPMTSNLQQFSKALYMFDRFTYTDFNKVNSQLNKKKLKVNESDRGVYIVRNRKDLGINNDYQTHIHLTKPHRDMVGVEGQGMFVKTKGEGAFNQVEKLKEIINGEYGKGIIYVRHHAVHDFVARELRKAGILFESINGKVTGEKRDIILRRFNNDEIDIVITSVTTSLDLDCDFVIFYEFTVDAKQIIGRSERGLIPKTIEIHFIFVEETGEVDYFLDKIYQRSLVVQTILGKNQQELVDIGKRLKTMKL